MEPTHLSRPRESKSPSRPSRLSLNLMRKTPERNAPSTDYDPITISFFLWYLQAEVEVEVEVDAHGDGYGIRG